MPAKEPMLTIRVREMPIFAKVVETAVRAIRALEPHDPVTAADLVAEIQGEVDEMTRILKIREARDRQRELRLQGHRHDPAPNREFCLTCGISRETAANRGEAW